jgi:hypothetical protein
MSDLAPPKKTGFRFPKGNKYNTKGFEKRLREARALAQVSATEAVEVTLEIMRDPMTPKGLRLKAAAEIMDRAGMKPVNLVAITDTQGNALPDDPRTRLAEKLLGMMEKKAFEATVVDVTPLPAARSETTREVSVALPVPHTAVETSPIQPTPVEKSRDGNGSENA